MHAHRLWRPFPVLLGAFGLIALTAASGLGQVQLESAKAIERNYGNHITDINKMVRGEAGGKDAQVAIDAAADNFTLRLSAGKFTPAHVDKFQTEVARFMNSVVDPPAFKQ